MTNADDIIKRLDAWGAEPAKGAKRDAVLAGILKDANAMVEAPDQGNQCLCGGMTGRNSAKWCSACLRGMLSTYGQIAGDAGASGLHSRLGEFVTANSAAPADWPKHSEPHPLFILGALAVGILFFLTAV